jgi:Fibronectin type III domain
MAKGILNLFEALLFTAVLTAATTPALAQEIAPIQVGETCQQKVAPFSWWLCGAVPAGFVGIQNLAFTNVGIHNVTLFTTGPDGIQCAPPLFADLPVLQQLRECGAVNAFVGLAPQASAERGVESGQLVYILRADRTATHRTIAVKFTAVPPNVALGETSPFSDARMFIESNATTEDVGVRAFLDGEPWNGAQIIGPDHRIFHVSGVGSLGELGLTELSFATHELAREDLSVEDLLALFPEGEYQFRGRAVEGDRLLGTATLTHDIPDAPQILTPEEGVLVDLDNVVISWDPVTEPAGIEVAGYRVSVERGDRGRTLSLELPPETTNVLVPPDFLEPGTDYLFKVLAIEAGGNQTITEGVFDTAEAGAIPAEPIAAGEVCQKKVAAASWHVCGAVPADGSIGYTNTGIHDVTVFTTGSHGIQCNPGVPVNQLDQAGLESCEILQIQEADPLVPGAGESMSVSKDQLVYIARAEALISDRTLAIQFEEVP